MEKDFPIFRNYLEEEDDKPYFTVNSLAYYYEDMERKQKLITDMSKLLLGYDNKLNVNLEEMEKRIAAELGKWDGKVEELPETVNGLLTSWAEDGTLSSVIDSTIVEEKLAPLTAQLADTAKQKEVNAMAISRFLSKVKNGKNVSITGIGDSIMEGYTTTNPVTDKYIEKLKGFIQTKYGVTVTLNNRATSGYSSAMFMFRGKYELAVADKADLYLISFGHNDAKGDEGNPWLGYPLKSSIGGIEHMIRRIRLEVPNADIILIGESPYKEAYEPMHRLINYNKEMEILANMYSCLYIDCYMPFIEKGKWDVLMWDTGHPNTLGHELMFETIKPYFDVKSSLNIYQPSIPAKTYAEAWRYKPRNWEQLTKDAPAGMDRFVFKGTWTASPTKTTTAGSAVEVVANASELMLEITVDPGTTLMYSVNGDVLISVMNVDIYKGGKNYVYVVPPTDYKKPVMSVQFYLRSGGLQVDNVWALKAPNTYVPIDSPIIQSTGLNAPYNNTSSHVYGNKAAEPVTATGYTLQLDFIGTGIALDMMGRATSIKLIPTVDGIVQPTIECGAASTVTTSKPVMLASGLPYGKHTLLLTADETSTQIPRLGGFVIIDERRIETPRIQRGVAKVGQTITYPTSYTGKPFLKLFGNGVFATNESPTGFTVSGTAGETANWEAEGNFVAF